MIGGSRLEFIPISDLSRVSRQINDIYFEFSKIIETSIQDLKVKIIHDILLVLFVATNFDRTNDGPEEKIQLSASDLRNSRSIYTFLNQIIEELEETVQLQKQLISPLLASTEEYSQVTLNELKLDTYHHIIFKINNLVESYNIHELLTINFCISKELVDSSQQSKKGVVYTPGWLVDSLVELTISNYNAKGKITLCDPSCGTGLFLIFSLDYLIKNYYCNKDMTFIKNNLQLYGYDIDKKSVIYSKLNLWLYLKNNKLSLNLLQQFKLINVDFLTLEGYQFSMIIGNPPFVPWYKIKDLYNLKKGIFGGLEFSCRPHHHDAHPNLYLFFLIQSVKLCGDEGIVSLIVPQEWLFYQTTKDFRNYLLNGLQITIISFPSTTKYFTINRGASTTVSFFLAKKSFLSRTSDRIRLIQIESLPAIRKMNFSKIKISQGTNDGLIKQYLIPKAVDRNWLPQDDLFLELENFLTKNCNNFVKLSNKDYFSVFGGFQPPIKETVAFTINKERYGLLSQPERKYVYPCIYNANDIRRYCISPSKKYWIVVNNLFDTEQEFKEELPELYRYLLNSKKNLVKLRDKWWEFPNVRNLTFIRSRTPKILAPRTASKNTFAFDSTGDHIIKGTNSAIVCNKHNPLFCLAILNSELANYYYKQQGAYYHGYDSRTRKYEPSKLKNRMIPLPRIEDRLIIDYCNKMITYHCKMIRNNQKFSNLDDKTKKDLHTIGEKLNSRIIELYNFPLSLTRKLSSFLQKKV